MSILSDLEFDVLIAKLHGKKGVLSDNYKVSINGDEIEVNLMSRPVGIDSLVTYQITSTGIDEFTGRSKPFSLIQEEIGNQLENFEGTPEEKYLLAFLIIHMEYVEKLESPLRKKLAKIIQRGQFNECY